MKADYKAGLSESPIEAFRGQYFFLSNFYEAKIEYCGYTFRNNEAAFQAMKCPERAKVFSFLCAQSARCMGRTVPLRADWEQVKEQIMYEICSTKFTQHLELAEKLLATGTRELIEGNYWGDAEWGVSLGRGENKLGKILMRIREEL